MYEVFILVPGKGWVLVRKYHDSQVAIAHAMQFEPLEVMVVAPDGNRRYGGRCYPCDSLGVDTLSVPW